MKPGVSGYRRRVQGREAGLSGTVAGYSAAPAAGNLVENWSVTARINVGPDDSETAELPSCGSAVCDGSSQRKETCEVKSDNMKVK